MLLRRVDNDERCVGTAGTRVEYSEEIIHNSERVSKVSHQEKQLNILFI